MTKNNNNEKKKSSTRKKKDLVEIFGHKPTDLSKSARSLWNMGACPFTKVQCTKINHDQTIIYGTCSVTSTFGDVVICPNRLYANDYESIKTVAREAFPQVTEVLMFSDYVERRDELNECIVALGKGSGREVQLKTRLSMDWVLAHVRDGKLIEYVGAEVQSIDITGNYRDAWHFYNNLTTDSDLSKCPSSGHGLNWANVHKRLIPQLIRKGVVYSRSKLVKRGLFFVLPDIVYRKFEDIVGDDIPTVESKDYDQTTLTVHTYELGELKADGEIRELQLKRSIHISLEDFSNRFVSGPNLPSGEDMDQAVAKVLGLL